MCRFACVVVGGGGVRVCVCACVQALIWAPGRAFALACCRACVSACGIPSQQLSQQRAFAAPRMPYYCTCFWAALGPRV
eukprot:13980482-Alexandrium_andersonii.AAC.1